MSRIAERFAALRARGRCALVPFLTAGDPDLATTEALALAIAEAGADAIELGIPFSDPIAEGPTIQRSSERALRSGTSLRRVLELVKALRPRTDVPLVLMGYANPVLALGDPAHPRPSDRRARSSRTCGASLSPRPERFTSTTASRESVGASLRRWAIACADSSAGMMPSVRESQRKASSASSSVALAYTARPASRR